MISNTVATLRVTDGDLSSTVSSALETIDFKTDRKVRSVFIKPNLCYYWDSRTGYTTDPRLVGNIIDVLRTKQGLSDTDIKIVEADATAMKTRHVFKVLGYEKLAKEKGVSLFNLTEDNTVTKKIKVGDQEITYEVPQSLVDADLFINVPKIKTTTATVMTCAMKNIFGCISTPRKIVYHPILEKAIVGINKILAPQVSLADGIVALSKHPVKMNVVVAGTSAFSVDYVVAKIMGYNPRQIGHLRLAMKEGLGKPEEIRVKGESISDLQKLFPHVSAFQLKWKNKLQLKLLKTYRRIVDDVIPPFLEA